MCEPASRPGSVVEVARKDAARDDHAAGRAEQAQQDRPAEVAPLADPPAGPAADRSADEVHHAIHDRLFGRTPTQADRSLSRSAGGLGIGLSLASRLVNLHGGSIEAKSPPEGSDKGSEFIIRLPLASPPPMASYNEPEVTLAESEGRRVLVVDDNVDQVLMIATLLRQAGHTVESAYNGQDGLKLAQQWKPDVVLLDIGLPGLDGYEVARRIRADPAMAAMRLIATTGYGRDNDIARASEAGFDGHMIKPYNMDALESLIVAPRA